MKEKKKFFTIYKITNIVNDKIYIGKHITSNINDNYMGSGNLIKKSINKYGIEHFKKDILYVFDNIVDMEQMERNIVNEEFVLRSDTYNITTGGYGGFQYANSNKLNNKVNQCYIVKEKIENNIKYAKWFSEQVSKGLKYSNFEFNTFLNKKHTEESKRKIGKANSIKQKGKNNSQYGTCWIMKDEINKKIKKEQLNNYLEEGWIKGRKLK